MRALLVLLAACGSSASDRDDPIPTTPLAGTINGMAWTAGGAYTKVSVSSDRRSVKIAPDTDLTCSSPGSEPYVSVLTPWVVGPQPVGLDSETSVFVFYEDIAHVVLDGRLEIDSAPTDPGAKAMLRLRARFADTDDDVFIEGQIEVEVCP